MIDCLSAIDIKLNETMVVKVGENEATIMTLGGREIITVFGVNGMTAMETAEYDVESVREAAGQTC